ncbi:MAG: hypothetical protein Q4E22_06520 [Coriobacteriia bacterium]|nr:hypothetical protein [Coriobacteriia bacterium]
MSKFATVYMVEEQLLGHTILAVFEDECECCARRPEKHFLGVFASYEEARDKMMSTVLEDIDFFEVGLILKSITTLGGNVYHSYNTSDGNGHIEFIIKEVQLDISNLETEEG